MENVPANHINVFLAEDVAFIRLRLAEMLKAIGNVTIVGEAETPALAIEGILHTRPDCVILDIHLIGGSGIEVLRKIRQVNPNVVFIVLTSYSTPQYQKAYLEAGANYFLDKGREFEKVKELIAQLGKQPPLH